MKKTIWLPISLTAALLATACTSKTETTVQTDSEETDFIDSTALKVFDWETDDMPMFIISFENLLVHTWDSQADSALYTPLAARYTTLISENKSYGIKFDHAKEGRAGKGCVIFGEYYEDMSGLYYKPVVEGELPWGYAFTQNFLNTHQQVSYRTFDGEKPVPAKMLDRVKGRYDGKIQHSWLCAQGTQEDLAVFTVQYEPKDTFCMAMVVVIDGDSTYVMEDSVDYYDDCSAWHADDGGEYGTLDIYAITRSAKGLDIFYQDPAPESVNPGVLMVRDGLIVNHLFNCYYNYVDYIPTPEPCELPTTAVLKAELDGYKVWVNEEIAPSEEDPCGQHRVFYSKPDEEGVVYYVATDSQSDEATKMLQENPWPSWVSHDMLICASDASLIKNPAGDVYLIIEGCPDARNVFTYMLSLPLWNIDPVIRWIPTNSGFMGLDESGELLKVGNYGYNDEGRYSVVRYYDFGMSLVREVAMEE